jgi:hypothetical protein
MLRTRVVALVALLAGALVFAMPPPVEAGFVLKFSEAGFADLLVRDNQTGDDDPAAGSIRYLNNYGSFTIDIVVGKSNSGNVGDVARLEIGALNITNTANAERTLTISLSDTGYTFPGGVGSPLILFSTAAGTISNRGGTVTFQSFADASNVEFGLGFGTDQLVFVNPPRSTATPFSGQTSRGGFTASGAFSLTNITTITLPAGGDLNSFSGKTELIIPAPGGLVLLLSGVPLIGLCWLRRRRQPA